MLSSAFALLALAAAVAGALMLAWTALRSVPLACIGAAALLAVVPGQLCRAVEHLPLAMALAGALLGLAALALRRLQRAHPSTAPAPLPIERPAPWALAVAAGALALVAHGAVTRNFFDEEAHVPFALVIARGVVPPEHVFAPGQLLPYHWGVDALYAQLIAGAGLRPDTAIDVVTILCWLLFVTGAAVAGAVVGGRRGATLAVVVVPLAGSPLAYPLHDLFGDLTLFDANPYPKLWADWFRRPPPITADFFQHPHGLAFPVVLAVLVLFTSSTSRARHWAGAALFALLSLIHAVHFLVLGFGLLVSVVAVDALRSLRAQPRDMSGLRRAAADAAALAGALAFAPVLGGFFAPSAGTASSLVWGVRFMGDPSLGMLALHHVVIFGLPLLTLPLVLPLARTADRERARLRVAVVAGAAVGFAVPNFVIYEHSWDIVKLYTAGAFLAGLGFLDVVTDFLALRSRFHWRRAVAAVAVVLTIAFPVVWLASRSVLKGRAGIPPARDWRLRDEVLDTGALVRPHVPPRARVLVGDLEYARMTGLFAPGFNAQKFISGHLVDFAATRALQATRDRALKHMLPEDLAALDVDFVLLTEREQRVLSEEGRVNWARLPLVDAGLAGGTELRRAH